MTSASEYNAAQIAAGKLTQDHIAEFIRYFQARYGLVADGKAGPATLAKLEQHAPVRWIGNPLPVLADGRRAVITSAFRSADRPTHDGVDMFYPWRPGDVPRHVGDGGGATRLPDGNPKWGVPMGTLAIAAAPGRVQLADNSPTGWRVWLAHGNGMRTGYFHLLDARVTPGQLVQTGHPLGLVGDNPRDTDARHLHFELSPIDRYDPVDPAPFMAT